jgi:hypothetical protein
MKSGDRILAIVLLTVSCLWTYQALRLPFPEFSRVSKMGPGHFPAGVGILLGLLSIVLLARTFRARASGAADIDAPAPRSADEGLSRQLILGFVMFAGYILVVPLAGFLLSSVVFIFLMVNRIGHFRWLPSGVISIAITVFLWLVFVHWLVVPIPTGPWGV